MIAIRKRLLMLIAALGLACNLALAGDAYIKLEIDSEEVFEGDIVRLNVESTGLMDPIDLSPIEAQATLLRETTGTRIAVFSGKVTEIAIRHMDLLPKRTGLLVFGPLIAGDVVSGSVFVRVLDQTRPEWQPETADLQIRTRMTPENPYLHQQTVLHIELLHRYPVSSETIRLPDLRGFISRPVLNARRTLTGDDRNWSHTEWRYLLFPTRSGQIPLDDIHWSGTTARSNTERAAFDRQSRLDPINVRPASDADHPWWLPATSLTLTEQWRPAATNLRAGDEIERIITVTADGVLSGQIPQLQVPESRAIRQTLIQTDRQEEITGDSVKSIVTYTYRVKAESPIPVFLDTVRLRWWNTVEDRAAEAIIPARRINVGLPDRADILSELARVQTGTSRWQHWIQSSATTRLMLYTAGTLVFLVLIWQLLPYSRRLHRIYTKRRERQRKLTRLRAVQHPQALYQFLQSADNRPLIDVQDPVLLNEVQQYLFSANTSALSPLQYQQWLDRVETALASHSPTTQAAGATTLSRL